MTITISRGIRYSMYRFNYPSDIAGVDVEYDVYTVYEPVFAKFIGIDADGFV